MWKDPIVAEVRKARREIAAECDYDLHRIAEYVRQVAADWPGTTLCKEELDRVKAAVRKRPNAE